MTQQAMGQAMGMGEEICREARALWWRLTELEKLAGQVESGSVGDSSSLRLRALELLDLLEFRIEREERELIPALLASCLTGGAGQAERLSWEHRERRLMLRLQLESVSDPERPAACVARRLRDFALLIREDMERAIHVAPDTFPLRGDVFAEVETTHLIDSTGDGWARVLAET